MVDVAIGSCDPPGVGPKKDDAFGIEALNDAPHHPVNGSMDCRPLHPEPSSISARRASLGNYAAKKVQPFAVMTKERLSKAPDIPTVDEAGLSGLYASAWYGLWAPMGTPKEIIAKLNEAVNAALADPELRKKLDDQAATMPAPDQRTPAALGAFQKAEITKWWPIIKAANIKPE